MKNGLNRTRCLVLLVLLMSALQSCIEFPEDQYGFVFYKQIPQEGVKEKAVLVWRTELDNKLENSVDIISLDNINVPDNGKIPLPGLRLDAVIFEPGEHVLIVQYAPANVKPFNEVNAEEQRKRSPTTIRFSYEKNHIYHLRTLNEASDIVYLLEQSGKTLKKVQSGTSKIL